MTSGGPQPREVTLSSCVKWRRTKLTGVKPKKLTGYVGFMPKEVVITTMPSLRPAKIPSLANSFKRARAIKKLTMK